MLLVTLSLLKAKHIVSLALFCMYEILFERKWERRKDSASLGIATTYSSLLDMDRFTESFMFSSQIPTGYCQIVCSIARILVTWYMFNFNILQMNWIVKLDLVGLYTFKCWFIFLNVLINILQLQLHYFSKYLLVPYIFILSVYWVVSSILTSNSIWIHCKLSLPWISFEENYFFGVELLPMFGNWELGLRSRP